jgi:hypothetical protein
MTRHLPFATLIFALGALPFGCGGAELDTLNPPPELAPPAPIAPAPVVAVPVPYVGKVVVVPPPKVCATACHVVAGAVLGEETPARALARELVRAADHPERSDAP